MSQIDIVIVRDIDMSMCVLRYRASAGRVNKLQLHPTAQRVRIPAQHETVFNVQNQNHTIHRLEWRCDAEAGKRQASATDW